MILVREMNDFETNQIRLMMMMYHTYNNDSSLVVLLVCAFSIRKFLFLSRNKSLIVGSLINNKWKLWLENKLGNRTNFNSKSIYYYMNARAHVFGTLKKQLIKKTVDETYFSIKILAHCFIMLFWCKCRIVGCMNVCTKENEK